MRWLRGLSPLLLAALALSCSSRPGVVRVATDPHDPPLSFLDDYDRRHGFEIDLMNAVAAQAGWTVEWKSVPQTGLFAGVDWDGILAGLRSKDYDLAISHVVSNSDLRLKWSVSRPYLWSGAVLVVNKDQKVTDVLELAGQPMATVPQPELDQVLLRARMTDDNQRRYHSLEDALSDLLEHRVAAVIAPLDAVAGLFEEQERFALGLRVAQRLTDDFPYAVFARAGDDERIHAVDQALTALEADGTLSALRQKWFLDMGAGAAR